jgi:hypothetical protein
MPFIMTERWLLIQVQKYSVSGETLNAEQHIWSYQPVTGEHVVFQAIILTPIFIICYYIQSVYVTINPGFPWQKKFSTKEYSFHQQIRLEFREETN